MSFYVPSKEVESLIKTVINKIKSDLEAKKLYIEFSGDFLFELKPEKFENAAGNRLFIIYPEVFGITKENGHSIRSYCQEACGSLEFKYYLLRIISTSTVK